MQKKDTRAEHLGWVETALQATNPDISHLQISAQVHYGSSDRFAFIDVFGIDDDRTRRRQIRADAGDFLQCLGYTVDLEIGRDIYDVTPIRPTSVHDRMWMLQRLHAASERER